MHMKIVHSSFTCLLCDKSLKSLRQLKSHEISKHAIEEQKKETGQKERREYSNWKPSYPVSKETFNKIKAGETGSTCPNCKKSFASYHTLFKHFTKIKCKKDQNAVEPSPDMAIVIKNKGEKHK